MGKSSITLMSAAIVAVLAVLAGTASSADKPGREVFITLQSDGTHCDVEKVKILCSDLVSHLRDVLKLPAGSRVRLRAGRSASYEAVRKVMDMLGKSEYPLPAAYLTEPKP